MIEEVTQLDGLIKEVANAGLVGAVQLTAEEAIQLTDEIMRLRGRIGAVQRCVREWARGKDARAVCAHIDIIVNPAPDNEPNQERPGQSDKE